MIRSQLTNARLVVSKRSLSLQSHDSSLNKTNVVIDTKTIRFGVREIVISAEKGLIGQQGSCENKKE